MYSTRRQHRTYNIFLRIVELRMPLSLTPNHPSGWLGSWKWPCPGILNTTLSGQFLFLVLCRPSSPNTWFDHIPLAFLFRESSVIAPHPWISSCQGPPPMAGHLHSAIVLPVSSWAGPPTCGNIHGFMSRRFTRKPLSKFHRSLDWTLSKVLNCFAIGHESK